MIKMKVDFEDFRSIDMLVDCEKNIVIFPVSKSKLPGTLPDGTIIEDDYLTAYFPIELKYPYTQKELAEKIKYGIEQWNVHECYENFSGRNTFEEKYYGIKGFKNAVKGKLFIDLGWNDILGKYVSLSMPLKRGYAYIGIDDVKLPDDADWMDFADAVIKYINMDLTSLRPYKTYKRDLNI